MPNVTVDLRVSADASANAEIFGQGPDPANYDVIEVLSGGNTLSAATLSSLIEFWEPSSNRGTRLASLTSGASGQKATLKAELADVINNVAGKLDATAAAPFNAVAYSNVDEYQKYENFGEIVLAYIAHHMFGHVQATAAITNDEAIVSAINGDGASHARIAEQLAEKMTNASATGGYTAARCLQIAEAVLGQDATRAMGADNSELPVDTKMGLSFQENDVVFIDVNLVNFTASLGSYSSITGVTAVPDAPSAKSYTLKLTLGA
jgi:hypothetical protein